MKYLVTGGAGFIGGNIVGKICSAGNEAVVFDNLSSGYKENLIDKATFINGDTRDFEKLNYAANGCDVIIHLAASVGNKRSIDDPIIDASTNLIGTINVLTAARIHGINRVVFSSSAGIFGELKTMPIREDHVKEPDSPYGNSKLAAENICLIYNKLYGMSNICLRYFNVYGRGQRYDAYGNVIPIFVIKMLKKEKIMIFGDGFQTRDFVNVNDVADANISASKANLNIHGTFNIGSGTRISINELCEKLIKLSGHNMEIEYGSERPGDVRDSLADISAASCALGYKPKNDIDVGLKEYLDWIIKDPVSNLAI